MRTVGIDIGSYSIKVAEVESSLKSVSVRDFFEIELTHEPGLDLRLERIEALRRIAGLYDPSTHRYIIGLGSEYSVQRVLTFPFLERKKILQSLPFELEDVIPFSQEDAVFDFRIIQQRESSSQVLAVAVPKKYLQELLSLCEDAGLDPDIISLEGTALSNLFEDYLLPPPKVETLTDTNVGVSNAEIVIHIGYSKTLVNVMREKSIVASRALYFGGKDLTNAISRAYQLPYLEALKGVAEKGFVLTSNEGASEDQVVFSNIVAQGLSQLVIELKRTIVDVKADLNVNFTAAHLMGGMSRLLNLGPYLTQQLEMPVNVYSHLGRNTHSDIALNESTDKASAIAVGLALEGVRRPKNPPINLRRGEFSKQSQNLKLMWDRYRDLATVGAALFIAFVIYSSFRASFIEQNLSSVDTALKTQAKNPAIGISGRDLKPENLKRFIKAKREEIESKKEVVRLNQMTSALDIVKSISQAAPQKGAATLDVRNFNIDGDRLTLEGIVASKAEFEAFQKNISTLPQINGVVAGTPRISAPGKYPFLVSMNVTRVPPSEKGGK
jgi:general secretion pathway protein L